MDISKAFEILLELRDTLREGQSHVIDADVAGDIAEAIEAIRQKYGYLDDAEIITSVSREDILSLTDADDRPKYDEEAVRNLDRGTLARIASKMGDAYCDGGYWIDLDILAESNGVKKAEYGKAVN